MRKFNKILAPAFLGLSMSLLFSVSSYASAEGWKAENGTWKYYKDYKALKSWQKLGNNWYFFNEDGSLKTGWLKDSANNWYFLERNSGSNQGVLLAGWQWIDGYCYYFETSHSDTLGRMYADTVVEGYKLSSIGRWVDDNGKEYYDTTKGIISNKEEASSNKSLTKKGSPGVNRAGGAGGTSHRSGGGSGSFAGSLSNDNRSLGSADNSSSSTKDNSNNGSSDNSSNSAKDNSSNSSSDNGSSANGNNLNNGSLSLGNTDSNSNSVTGPDNASDNQSPSKQHTDSNAPAGTNAKQNTVPNKLGNKESEDTIKETPNTSNENSTSPSPTDTHAKGSHTHSPSADTKPADNNTATSSNAAPKPEKPENKEIPNATEDSKKQEKDNKPKEQEENKAAKVKDSLTTAKNNNVVQYTDENGKIRTIIWAKGISAPLMGENGDFRKEITHADSDTYIDYKAPFAFGNSWYDINKSRAGGNTDIDKNLCFGATSANMLYWWLEQNSSYIDAYIAKEGDITRSGRSLSELRNSFNNQQDSGIFELFKVLFGYNDKGFYSDLLMDLFINGYTPKNGGGTNLENENMIPDNRGGFFYNVFKEVKLTERTYGGSYEDLSEKLKDILGNEGIIGISHKTFGSSSHIVTLWGAEYDLNGKLSAVYISDSDDQNEEADETDLGMKRYEVRNVGGIAKLSTNQSNKNTGSAIGYLHVLYLGTEQWQSYIDQ